MQRFNYHTHTERCHHAQPVFSDEDYVVAHIKSGFDAMAFTDHCPEKEIVDIRPHMRMSYAQRLEYLESIRKLQAKYENQITIKSGYEIEFLPGQEENLFELKNEVDIIALGQHFVYDDSMERLLIFRHHVFTDEELERYADYIEEAVRLGLPDYIAHPDIYMIGRKKFGTIEEHICRRICELAERYSIPLEINFGQIRALKYGLIYSLDYPCRDFWRIVAEHNIKVIYGIDEHFRSEIEDVERSFGIVESVLSPEIISKLKFCNEQFEIIK